MDGQSHVHAHLRPILNPIHSTSTSTGSTSSTSSSTITSGQRSFDSNLNLTTNLNLTGLMGRTKMGREMGTKMGMGMGGRLGLGGVDGVCGGAGGRVGAGAGGRVGGTMAGGDDEEEEEGQEVLSLSGGAGGEGGRFGVRGHNERNKNNNNNNKGPTVPLPVVPSPTLSYYTNFIPVTPAPAPPPVLPAPGRGPAPGRPLDFNLNLGNTTQSTSFAAHRNSTFFSTLISPTQAQSQAETQDQAKAQAQAQSQAQSQGQGRGRGQSQTQNQSGLTSYRIKRKNPPAPLDLHRPGSFGGGNKVGFRPAAGAAGVGAAGLGGRGLPEIVILDSPGLGLGVEDELQGEGRNDDGGSEQGGRAAPGGVGGGIRSLWRTKSKSTKSRNTTTTTRTDNPTPSPDWVEVEQGYRHPSHAFGLDVDLSKIELLQPRAYYDRSKTDLPRIDSRTGGMDGVSPGLGTGGVLHDILLTPTCSGSHLFGSGAARQRTPSPSLRNESTLDLIPTLNKEGSASAAAVGSGEKKRMSLLDRAGRMFNDQRLKVVYDSQRRRKGDIGVEGSRGVRVGGIVPSSLTGFDKGGVKRGLDLDAPGFLPMHRIPTGVRTDSFAGSGDEGKGRYGLDSARDGSGWGQVRGAGGHEIPGRRSTADRDMLLRKQRRKKLWILVALGLLILASAIIGLCAGLLTRTSSSTESTTGDDSRPSVSSSASSPSSTSSPPASTSSAYTLSTCLSLFALSAPTAPTSYPCDQCLSILNTGENDYRADANDGTGPSGNSTGVGAAVQFCALQSIFGKTQGTVKRRKRAGVLDGWMVNTNPCSGWSGVTCDSKARVRSLSLVYPGVPSTLDDSIGGLAGLESIKIVGNSVLPAGPIPNSIFSSTLKTIEIQSTGLTSLATNAFASLSTLTSLVLVSNAKLGTTLPALPQTLGLSTISVTGQSLSVDPFPALPASLSYIDVSYNALSGAMPSLSKFTGLQSLFLDSNSYESLTGDFPASLQDLSIQGNPSLAGALPTSLCSSVSLKTCELQGTSLGSANAQNTTTTQVGAIATRVVNATATTTIMTTATAISTTAARCGICRF